MPAAPSVPIPMLMGVNKKYVANTPVAGESTCFTYDHEIDSDPTNSDAK